MSDDVVVVTGATGHIGGRIAARLLEASHRVRVTSREAERLEPWVERGAEPYAGSVEEPPFVEGLLTGARAAFLLLPPKAGADYPDFQDRVGTAYAKALPDSGVTHVVHLSSLGADVEEGTGPIAGLNRSEERLRPLEALHVLHLRPASFMENQLEAIPVVRSQGFLASPLRADLPMPHVATRDVGDVAAAHLAARDFEGHSVRELLGPRDYTMTEVAEILGASIGEPDLAYVELGYDEFVEATTGQGMDPGMAELLVEMYRAMNEERIQPVQGRLARTETPTTYEAWAREVFAPAYREAGSSG